MAAAGDEDFQEALQQTWADLELEEHIGEEVTDIWEGMNQTVVYLPIIIK